jgi:hypothetical protein
MIFVIFLSFMVHLILKYSSFHMNCWTNRMFSDICKMVYQLFFIKTIGDNYIYYSCYIIILGYYSLIITTNLNDVNCEPFKMSKVSQLTMFLLRYLKKILCSP